MGSPIRIHYKRISGVSDVPRPANPQLFFQVETKFFGRRFFHLRGFFVSAGRVRPVAQPCGHSSRKPATARSFRFTANLRPVPLSPSASGASRQSTGNLCAGRSKWAIKRNVVQSADNLFQVVPGTVNRSPPSRWTHKKRQHFNWIFIKFNFNSISSKFFYFFFFNLQLKLKASVANRSRYISLAAAEEGVSLRWFA